MVEWLSGRVWLRKKAWSIILAVFSGYVRVFVCAMILMVSVESECMVVSFGLSCASRHARAACMACSYARVTGVWTGSLPQRFRRTSSIKQAKADIISW